jgi:hypothetical protein
VQLRAIRICDVAPIQSAKRRYDAGVVRTRSME